MFKLKDLPLYKQAVRVYLITSFLSFLFSPLFTKLYIFVINPYIPTSSLFMPIPPILESIIGGTLEGIYFFLPLLTFWLIKKYQWRIWFIGISLPLLIDIVSGSRKDIYLAFGLTVAGWLLAQMILLFRRTGK
jgi:hypothetical protein